MRIAVIHSFYRSAVSSGENNTVLAQVEALRGAGHEVKLIAQYTDENRKGNPLYPVKAGFDVATGNGYDPTEELKDFRPDIVWVHNLFPNFGTKWLAQWEGPIMATLHNYRPVCANGVLFRDGAICTLCPDGKPLSALKYGCYKDSRLASLPLTIQISKGLDANPLLARADKIVVLSPRAFNLLEQFGLDPKKMTLLPTFVNEPRNTGGKLVDNGRWVIAARLGTEKGVYDLIKIWPRSQPLDVYGAGPDLARLKAFSSQNIKFYGNTPFTVLSRRLPRYLGLVFSSIGPETQGAVVIEAFASGVPVVARIGSAGADWVEKFEAGKTYSPTTLNLEHTLYEVIECRNVLGDNARRAFSQNFTEEIWLSGVSQLVDEVLGVRVG
jgi:glycosyltransferase involved in cell wall biosynthesis